MYLSAMPIVPMLAMGEWNIRIGFLAGEHGCLSQSDKRQFFSTSKATLGASEA